MSTPSDPVIFQLKAVIAGISPMIWRQLLVHSDTTIAELHYLLQIVFGWSDYHLHRFVIHGKPYGIHRTGSDWFSDDAKTISLSNLGLRVRERFLYQYDFCDDWQVQIRVENIAAPESGKSYPRCIKGKRAGPPEDCGGPLAFQALRQEYSDVEVAYRIAQIVVNGEVNERKAELRQLQYWLFFEHLDLPSVNHRLQQSLLSNDPAFQEEFIYLGS